MSFVGKFIGWARGVPARRSHGGAEAVAPQKARKR